MTPGGYKHTSGVKGNLERRLMPIYLVFLLVAPFAVALLFVLKGYPKVAGLLIIGNGLPAYMMLTSMHSKPVQGR